MKNNNLSLSYALIAVCIICVSCSTIRQSAFTERKYYNFRHHDPIVVLNSKSENKGNEVVELPVKAQKEVSAENRLTVVAAKAEDGIANKPAKNTNTIVAAVVKENQMQPLQTAQQAIAPAIQAAVTAGNGDDISTNTVVLIILAILISPLAVYLYDKAASTRFIIVLVLWLLGVIGYFAFVFAGLAWLAAVIYAILIVTGSV